MTGQKGRSGGRRPGSGRPRQSQPPATLPSRAYRISGEHAAILDIITERWNARKPEQPVTPRRVVELLISQQALAEALNDRDA